MKKIYSLLGAVFMLCCLFNVVQAQDAVPASAKWSFVKPTTGTGTGDEVTNTGAVAGVMSLHTMKANGYVTSTNPLLNTLRYQRSEGEDGIQFPANQTDMIPGTYIQFAVTPAQGQSFNLNSLTYDIGSQGSTSGFRTKVFYSTNADFSESTQITAATGNEDDIVTRDDFKAVTKTLDVTVNNGETVYIRFFPWMHEASTVQTGKYLVLRDVTIAGTTTAADDEDPGDEEPVATKKVLYVTEDKAMAETASSPSNDPIIRMLQADEKIEVTVRALTAAEAGAATTEIDMAEYDAVVVQESIGGSRAVLTPAGPLGLAKFTKPVLYNKTYALNGGRAFAAGTPGGGVEASTAENIVLSITVPTASRDNELFNGIEFAESGEVELFKLGALDNGGVPEGTALWKGLNFSNNTVLSADNTLLANVAGLATTGTPVFINDIPAGTTIGSEETKARIVMVGMNFGAISRDNGTNMTAENLTLWRNAVYSLVGLEVPNTLVGEEEEPVESPKVAYVTYKKEMDPTAAATENDPIIQMLKADENIDLTVIALETAGGTADLSGFDVVVVQEGFGSGDAIFKPGGSLALNAITVPFLYNKTYALRNGNAVVAGGGTSAEATGLAITVPEANREHELFNGITFTEGAFNVFKSAATDLGAEGTKTFNFTSGLTLSAGNTLLGTAPEVAAADAATTVFLNDIPAGTTIGDQVTQARMIAVGFNTGAIAKDNGTNMTAEGLTLWRNAVYSLAGLEVPTTLVDPGVVTSIKDRVAGSTFSLSQNYPNPFNSSTTIQYEIKKSGYVALEVYDALGRRVATLTDGNQAAGTYEVQLNKNLSNGLYFYKLSTDGSSLTRRMLVTQ